LLMDRRPIIAAVVVALLAALIHARPALIITHSGQRIEGDCTEREDDLIVRIHGVATIIPREHVASLEYQKEFAVEFAERLQKIDSSDAAGRIELARWAIEQRQYLAAREAVDAALNSDPNNAEAAELARLVQGQLRLAAKARARQTEAPAAIQPMAEAEAPASSVGGRSQRLLSIDEVQAVRRAEWQVGNESMRVRVDPKMARAYAESRQIRAEDFLRLRPIEQARVILEDKYATQEQRGAVSIFSDPPAIAEFRRIVQPLILNGCATSGCHGGVNAQKFTLVSPVASDEAAYSNFVMLSKYSARVPAAAPSDGMFGGETNLKMIDRGNGRRSLLIQYALPPEVAEFDHPTVRNLTPLFRSMDDPRAAAIVDWMDNSLRQLPLDYGRELAGRTTQPATRPGN
jgi:hypothetical protein